MNSVQSSKKRKISSFANDRLKRLRTSLNEEVVTNASKNTPTTEYTPSVKHNIQNNPVGYPERKKLVPVRKLKQNVSERNSQISNEKHRKDNGGSLIAGKSTLPIKKCTSGRKGETIVGTLDCLKRRLNEGTSTTSSACPAKKAAPIQRGNTSDTNTFNRSINKNINTTGTRSPMQSSSPIKTQKSSHVLNKVETPKNTNKSLAHSQSSNMKNNGSGKFSDICSTKTDFKYQHVSNIQSSQVHAKSSTKDCSSPSFGQAINSLYNKLFSSDQNKVETAPRNEIVDADSMDWEPEYADFSPNVPEPDKKKSDETMYIIVDTNIFLDSLSFLERIVSYGSNEGVKPVIYVPWMVFNELDFIKDNKTSGMKPKACKAIDFINKMLVNREGKLIGQSIYEANNQMYVGKSPDDKITSCCLQVKEKGLNTILLSNDKNLRNKLIIHGIPSLSCNDLLKNFDNITSDNNNSPHADKIEKLLDKMSRCCTVIIKECCEEAYGSIWNKLALLDKQPWSFKICLDILKKYWSAVFREKLLKQCLKIVEKMVSDLRNPGTLKYPETFESFANDCLSLCFFLMDIEQHKDLIAETTKEINLMVKQKS